MKSLFSTAVVVLVLATLGCGGAPGPPTHAVFGSVTLDGQRLADGDVLFDAEDGRISDGGKVTSGKYRFQATPGKKKVRIQASTIKEGGQKGAMDEPVAEQYLPARYNTATSLRAEVTSGGMNQFD